MDKYKEAYRLFGVDGAEGEAEAITGYLTTLMSSEDETIRDHIKERLSDEINHLLGNVADAVRISGLKISSDGIEEILKGLKNAVE